MTSPARVLLRSRILHRNIDRVLSGQVRHLHGNAAKPVFHWEVSPTATPRRSCWFPNNQSPYFQDPLDLESQISAEEIAIRYALVRFSIVLLK